MLIMPYFEAREGFTFMVELEQLNLKNKQINQNFIKVYGKVQQESGEKMLDLLVVL